MKPERPTSPVVSFRLKPDEVRLLAERAERLGVSPNELARYYVIEAIFAAVHLAELALEFAVAHLKPGGHFLVKTFQGEGFDAFRKAMMAAFDKVTVRKPKSSRDRSSEVYLLGLGSRPHPRQG